MSTSKRRRTRRIEAEVIKARSPCSPVSPAFRSPRALDCRCRRLHSVPLCLQTHHRCPCCHQPSAPQPCSPPAATGWWFRGRVPQTTRNLPSKQKTVLTLFFSLLSSLLPSLPPSCSPFFPLGMSAFLSSFLGRGLGFDIKTLTAGCMRRCKRAAARRGLSPSTGKARTSICDNVDPSRDIADTKDRVLVRRSGGLLLGLVGEP